MPSPRPNFPRKAPDFDVVIDECSRKLLHNPQDVQALMLRAQAYAKKGKLCPHPPILTPKAP